jgi:hypothetical protein
VEGALPERVTVPVELAPPPTEVGLKVTDVTVGVPVIVSDAFAEPPLTAAEIVDVNWAAVRAVVTVKVPLVAPAATLTVAGTVALLPVAVIATLSPADGAGPLRVKEPADVSPPLTDVGFNNTPVTTAGFTVSVADFVFVPTVALIDGVA